MEGLEIFNDANYIQLSSDYRNFGLVGHAYGTGNLSTNEESPIVATRSIGQGAAAAVRSAAVSASNVTFTMIGAGGSYDSYLFSIVSTGQSRPNFGLELFKEDGSLGYCSNFGAMRVLGIVSVDAFETTFFTQPAGRSCAVVTCLQLQEGFFPGIGTGQKYIGCPYLDGSSFKMARILAGGIPARDQGNYVRSGAAMILDVTGF